jgi:hypothetical protein
MTYDRGHERESGQYGNQNVETRAKSPRRQFQVRTAPQVVLDLTDLAVLSANGRDARHLGSNLIIGGV